MLDQISLEYGKIVREYIPTAKSGKPEPSIAAGWNLATNTKIWHGLAITHSPASRAAKLDEAAIGTGSVLILDAGVG